MILSGARNRFERETDPDGGRWYMGGSNALLQIALRVLGVQSQVLMVHQRS